ERSPAIVSCALGLAIPWAWVGPPATSSVASRTSSGDRASTVPSVTSPASLRPAAIACAIVSVLPNIDSSTTTNFISRLLRVKYHTDFTTRCFPSPRPMVLPDAGRVSPGALACSFYVDAEMGEDGTRGPREPRLRNG